MAPVAASPSQKQNSQSLPRIEQILDNHLQAVGGREAWEKVQTLHETDTLEFPKALGGTAVGELWFARNRCYIAVTLRGASYKSGFDGETGWSIDPRSGLKKLNGEDLAPSQRNSLFPEEIRLRELVSRMSLKRTALVNGHQAYVIEVKFSKRYASTMYFDSKTWLKIREDVTQVDPSGHQSVEEIYFDDFRDIPDLKIKVAFRRTEKSAQHTVVERVKELRFNVPVDESLFKPPSSTLHIQR